MKYKTDKKFADFHTNRLIELGILPAKTVILSREMQALGDVCLPNGQYIELKIVRWPNNNQEYTAVTLEEWSNLEHQKPGWMYTGRYHILMWVFIQKDGLYKIYAWDFRQMRKWFDQQKRYYFVHDEDNGLYTTRSRIVPLTHLRQFEIGLVKK